MRNRKLKIGATVAVAVVGIGVIAASSLGDIEYYQYVDAVVANPKPLMDKKVIKVHGYVVPGSIQTDIRDQMTYRTFELERKGKTLKVRHRGVVPDTFKDQAETVVTGRLAMEGSELWLLAVDGEAGIMAKCPSKYEGK